MPAVLIGFPDTRHYAGARLVTWHPRGVFDDQLADRITAFVEAEESISDRPFHRYADFSGLTEIHLKVGHAFKIAERRRASYDGEPVKSAIFSDWVVGFGIARLYQELMQGGPIEVRAFRTREEAAQWLGVPVDILLPQE